MVLPGHLAGGYLVTRALLFVTHVSLDPTQITTLLIVGTLAGEIPDIDLAWFYVERNILHRRIQHHRDYVTHAPIVWLVLSLFIVVLGYVFNSAFTQFIGLAILCGSWSHFVLDSLEYGIMWLWPFSRKRFALLHIPEENVYEENAGTIPHYIKYLTTVYIKRWSFLLEIIVSIIAIYVLLVS